MLTFLQLFFFSTKFLFENNHNNLNKNQQKQKLKNTTNCKIIQNGIILQLYHALYKMVNYNKEIKNKQQIIRMRKHTLQCKYRNTCSTKIPPLHILPS